MNLLQKIMGCLLVACIGVLPLGAAPITAFASSEKDEGTHIVQLTTEYQKDPIGIDVSNPRFGWRMESNRIGQRQEAFEIKLYESADPSKPVWTKAEASGQSVGIVYDGAPLKMAAEYYWIVAVTASDGNIYTSERGYFETGVTDLPEWQNAKFIQLGSDSCAPIFRTEADLDGSVKSARLYITALGAYQAYINGKQVVQINHDGTEIYPHMAPGHGNANTAWYYQTYDVTSCLKDSQALALAIIGGTGWYNGQMAAATGAPAVKALLRIVYDDGSISYVDTNLTSWKVSQNGGIRKQGIYYGEWYDANAEEALGDYKNPGYDDSGWIGTENSDSGHIITNRLDGITARYVRLKVDSLGPLINGEPAMLQIMELEIFDKSGNNVALNKTAWSPQNWEPVENWKSVHLTDGEYGTQRDFGFTTTYNPSMPVYVTVDLGQEYELSQLKIHCRSKISSQQDGVCPNYPKEYTIQTAAESDFSAASQPKPGYNDAASAGWTDALKCDAGTVSFKRYLTEVSYPGRLIAQQGPIGHIVDEFEESPKSAVIYDGEAGKSDYAGGEINTVAYYAYEQPDDDLYNKNVTITDSSEKIFDSGITLPAGKTMVVDFGQNMTAIPELLFSAGKNTRVTMRFAEILNDGSKRYTDSYGGDAAAGGDAPHAADGPKGSVYLKSLRTAKASVDYVFSGRGKERYQPTMTFFGYRYIELTATQDVTIYGIRSRAISSVSERTGFIETNNADINRLFLNSMYGQLSNNFTITTGCPQRDERESWTGDAQVFTQTAVYHFDSAAFLNYYQNILSDHTRQKGFPGSTTSYGAFVNTCTSGWDDIEITQPWLLYLQTGDPLILEQNWDAMTAYMNFMITHERSNTPYRAPEMPIAFGDWLSFQGTCIEVITDLYYGYTMQIIAKMAKILGKTDEANYYSDRAQKMKDAFIKAHVTFDSDGKMTVHSEIGRKSFGESGGPLEPNSQTALLWMLKLDYFNSDDARQQAAELLVKNVKNENPDPGSVRADYGPNSLSVGFLGANVLTPVLTEIGAADVAYDVILNDDMPSWLLSVENGATTMWERWDSYSAENGFGDQGMNSFNHFANGSVAEWMYRYMAGIAADPSEPGFRNVILQPVLDTGTQYNQQERIHQVNSSYTSYYGDIVSNWESKDGALIRYETVVPANATADLFLPVAGECVKDFANIPGVAYEGTVVHNGQETAHFKLQSGGYVFGVNGGNLTVNYAEGYAADTAEQAAAAVDKLIGELGEITSLEQKGAVEAAISAYEALSDEAKALVTKLDVLVAAEDAIKALENPVIEYKKGDIDKNGTVNVSDMLALKNLIMTGQWNDEQLKLGDMDDNKTLNVSDMLAIKNLIMSGAG